MNDLLPEQTVVWRHFESVIRNLLDSHGYQEVRMPVVEKTELFKRSIGEVTDIVEKEMYTFEDRNGESLTLRPEGTAGCVRAALQHGLIHNQTQRLWYAGQMYRYERPQKGRYRQFHQVGVEAFGIADASLDAELILMTANLWKKLGLTPFVRLEINSLGDAEERKLYREKLIAYFEASLELLDEDSKRRLHSNPLRILDSKNPEMQVLIEAAPRLMDHLGEETKAHFEKVCKSLDAAGVEYQVNTRLVRGLDYYNRTVFEWVTDHLGAQGTVCGGGRYDGLVEQLGGKPTCGAGFAMGVERLVALLQDLELLTNLDDNPHAYLMRLGEQAEIHGLALANRLRDAVPGLRLLTDCQGGAFKKQFKRADKSGAQVALVVGEDEISSGQVQLKPLRTTQDQQALDETALIQQLKQLIA